MSSAVVRLSHSVVSQTEVVPRSRILSEDGNRMIMEQLYAFFGHSDKPELLWASGCPSPRISYRKLLTGLGLGLLVILRAYIYLKETSNFDS